VTVTSKRTTGSVIIGPVLVFLEICAPWDDARRMVTTISQGDIGLPQVLCELAATRDENGNLSYDTPCLNALLSAGTSLEPKVRHISGRPWFLDVYGSQ